MINTKIEYCDETSNFVTGCLHLCKYCYARPLVTNRLANIKSTVHHQLKIAGLDPFSPSIHLNVLRKLEHRLTNVRTSRRVFIASLGDIGCKAFFHVTGYSNDKTVLRSAWTTGDVLKRIFDLCVSQSRHTFLLLSKNPRMFRSFKWPQNVHVGTSIDTANAVATGRLMALSSVDAHVRWVSVEPLLDPDFLANKLGIPGFFKPEFFKPAWIVVGGLSRGSVPDGCLGSGNRIKLWCAKNEIPLFVKGNFCRQFHGEIWPQEYP